MVFEISMMIFVPIIGSLAVYLAGRKNVSAAKQLSLVISLFVLALSVYTYGVILVNGTGGAFNFVEGPVAWAPAFRGVDYFVGIDGLGAPLVLITGLLTVLVIFGSFDLITERQATYYALIMFFEGLVMGVFVSLNLILFYVFWELVLVPMFFFIGIWGGPRRKYAAMKFFLFTFAGGAIMLIGFLAIYLFGGNTFNITEVAKLPFWVQVVASVATFAGFGVKLPVFPFHTWLPDAHVEAPAPISVLLAGILLKMGGYGFIRVNLGMFPEASREFAWIFITIGIITMFYGAIVAMIQKDLKRMIALTSINHMGFVLLGVYAGVAGGTANSALFGISGAVFQMFNHATAIGILFMLSGYIHEQTGTRDLTILKGLRWKTPRTATLLILASMAGMGVPIFSTFISEYFVIVSAIAVDARYAVTVLIPVITVSYFLWMLRRTVMSPPHEGEYHEISSRSATHLTIYLVPMILTLLFPWLILNVIDPLSQGYISSLIVK